MPTSALFEDFSEIEKPQEVVPLNAEPPIADSHSAARQSFDDGYKEGWVDAQAAAKLENNAINSDVATALQEAGFAYFEARQHIFNSMRPLLEAIVRQVVPKLSETTLIPIVVEEVEAIALLDQPPLNILCAPEIEEQLRQVLATHLSFPVEVSAETTLSKTQVLLQLVEGETHIDLSNVLQKLETSLSDFYELTNEKEVVNG